MKKYPNAKIDSIQLVYDHFVYVDGLKGVALYERISRWIWNNDKTGLSPGTVKYTEDVRDTMQDFPGIYFKDVGVIVTPNMQSQDDDD